MKILILVALIVSAYADIPYYGPGSAEIADEPTESYIVFDVFATPGTGEEYNSPGKYTLKNNTTFPLQMLLK